MGTKLSHPSRLHKDREVTASVNRQGIAVRGRTYATPSAAAKAVTGKPVDGWHFWKLPDGQPLDKLRTERQP